MTKQKNELVTLSRGQRVTATPRAEQQINAPRRRARVLKQAPAETVLMSDLKRRR
jgi:hypothetical protein